MVRTPASPSSLLRKLHEQCSSAVDMSLDVSNEAALGTSLLFGTDLEAWHKVLLLNPFSKLIQIAAQEYTLTQVNLCQGQYRNAFKGLRLVLELCVQSAYLSTDLLNQEEWLKGEKDTSWTLLVDAENGPFGTRFARAFFPEVSEHLANFRAISKSLYRELSECIHGNVPIKIPLPSSLEYNKEVFELWHEKARLVRLVVLFCFALRFLRSVSSTSRHLVVDSLSDQLGHIDAIRTECINGN